MKASGQRKFDNRHSVFRICIWASLLVFSALLGNCSWRSPGPGPSAPSDSFTVLKQRVASIRGLAFKRDVSLEGKSPPVTDFPPEKEFGGEYGAQPVPQLSRVYKRLGLLPASTDLAKALADFQRLQRISFSDDARETIVPSSESVRLGRALAGDDIRAAEQIPVVFALTQALQEQNFQWNEKLKLIAVEDRKLAFRAVARGDIVLMGLAHLGGSQTPRWSDQVQAIGRLTSELDRMASHLPPMLREKLVFPYREGSQFVQWAYAAKGSSGVNGLFVHPPLSSAQILHPEKYFIRRQNPVRIVPWGLIQKMRESPVVDQTLGEYLVQVLLASSYGRSAASQIASGWTGDQLSAYQLGEDLITCWVSAWRNDGSAQEFFRAFETVLEQYHGWRFETPDGQKNSLRAVLSGGRSVVLQVRGSLVLFLDGIALTRVLELTEAIWQEMETGMESTVIPFESARGRLQWASRSR